MAELAGEPAADGASAVRLLQTQLQAAQDALARLQEESSSTIQALRTVAERLSEEKLRAEAALAAKSREQAVAVEATAQHVRDLAAAQEAHVVALREERARLRAAEALLAEVPPPEELAAQQQAAAARLASAVARVVELERELSTVRDTVVSERVEQLVARVRALETELAEQEGGAEELKALRASAAAEAKRASQLEAAGAAALDERGAEVARLVAQNKLLEQALQEQRAAVVSAPPPMAVVRPAVAKQPVAAAYPDDIQSQLRRIEALLESLPVPPSSMPALAPSALLADSRAASPPASLPPASRSRTGFVRAPPGRFTLRRHIFR